MWEHFVYYCVFFQAAKELLFFFFRPPNKEEMVPRLLWSMSLALLLFGLFLLISSPVGAEPELQDEVEEEEESSCQGAFDLYFVLDK